jgi:lactoylglutathione lyase
MSQDLAIAFSHVAICTSDLDRSLRFYTEALGFELERTLAFDRPFDTLTELPGLRARAHFLKRDGVTLELLGYDEPAPVGPAERRPMNQLGFTHMGLVVGDLDGVAQAVEAHGGHSHRHTRVAGPAGQMMFCTDPDGVRLELWQRTGG